MQRLDGYVKLGLTHEFEVQVCNDTIVGEYR